MSKARQRELAIKLRVKLEALEWLDGRLGSETTVKLSSSIDPRLSKTLMLTDAYLVGKCMDMLEECLKVEVAEIQAELLELLTYELAGEANDN